MVPTSLCLLLFAAFVYATPRPAVTQVRVVQSAQSGGLGAEKHVKKPHHSLADRQITTSEASTCGYYGGDESKSRTAAPGFVCRFDVANGIWGFCPTSVIAASDCGLAGACIDHSSCKSTCGKLGEGLTTVSCTDKGSFCSTVLVDAGVDQTYSYIACGAAATEETLLAYPTQHSETTATSTSTSRTTTEKKSNPSTETASAPNKTSQAPSPSSNVGNTSTLDSQLDNAAKDESDSSSSTSTPAIIGGVVGGVALICATVVAIVYIRRGKRHRQNETPEGPNTAQTGSGLYYPDPSKEPPQWQAAPLYETLPQELDAGAASRRRVERHELSG